jgi:uncharacterized DUF497 family protein
MRFRWDAKKNSANIRKHGISFMNASRIFSGPTLEDIDETADYGEERIKAIGLVEGIEIFVVYTDRARGERRIISARKANEEERQAYWKALGSTYR